MGKHGGVIDGQFAVSPVLYVRLGGAPRRLTFGADHSFDSAINMIADVGVVEPAVQRQGSGVRDGIIRVTGVDLADRDDGEFAGVDFSADDPL